MLCLAHCAANLVVVVSLFCSVAPCVFNRLSWSENASQSKFQGIVDSQRHKHLNSSSDSSTTIGTQTPPPSDKGGQAQVTRVDNIRGRVGKSKATKKQQASRVGPLKTQGRKNKPAKQATVVELGSEVLKCSCVQARAKTLYCIVCTFLQMDIKHLQRISNHLILRCFKELFKEFRCFIHLYSTGSSYPTQV